MIENVKYIAENGILIEYLYNQCKKQISFKSVSSIWQALDEDTFEGGKAYVWGDNIAFSAVIASGQGGVFFVWDSIKEYFVHYSSCDYFSDALLVDDIILLLCEVTNYTTPYHLEVYSIPFGITNINECGQCLSCGIPEKYSTSSPMGVRLQLSGNVLEIVDDNCAYALALDIDQIKKQKSNP